MRLREEGMTLIEIVVVLAVIGVLIPLLSLLMFQPVRMPTTMTASLEVQSELRYVDRWFYLDGVRANSFVLAPEPEFGTFGWHDYSVSPPQLHQVVYSFEDGELIRSELVNGAPSQTIVVASEIARYDDIGVVACPTYVRITPTVTAERTNDTLRLGQEFVVRLRPEPWGEITEEPLGYALLAFGGDGNGVFKHAENGTSLGDLTLARANSHAVGITTDGTSVWVLDADDAIVYRYNTSGAPLDSFALTTDSEALEGIATDGTYLWVTDEETAQVYRYSTLGGLLDSFSAAPATYPAGIATDGSSLWVADRDTGKVYEFSLAGAAVGSFDLGLLANDLASGLTRLPSGALWVLDATPGGDSDIDISGSDNVVVGNVHAHGDVSISGSRSTITNSLTSRGDVRTSGSDQTITDAMTVNGDFTVSGSNNTVEGATTVHGTFTVSGSDNSFGASEDTQTLLRPLPVNCPVDEFPPPTFSWAEDVNLVQEEEVWEDWPTRSRLKPGVYSATGRIDVSGSLVTGTVTFIADQVHISGSEVDLWPYYGGITAYGTGAGNDVIKLAGSIHDGTWRGMIYAPEGQVHFSGSGMTFYGSVVGQDIKIPGSDIRVVHNAY